MAHGGRAERGLSEVQDTFIVIDTDPGRKAAVARALADCGYVIPIDSIDDVAPVWPDHAWLIVTSEHALAEATLTRLNALGRFYPLIMYGEALSVERISALLHNGLVGTLPLPFSTESARACLGRLQPVADRLRRSYSEGREALRKIARLSAREEQVFALVSEGLSNKEISMALGISPRTVEIHRASAITKLEVPNSFAAARLFFQANASMALCQIAAEPVPAAVPLAA